jgi:type II secretory pathway component PulC
VLTFKAIGNKLERVREVQFKEKDLQTIVESNLEQVFGLQFVTSELATGSFRFDTLAFDPQAKAFVIIEYKKDSNMNVVDQGFAYLSTLLRNKAEFILEYNEHSKSNLKRDDVDWTQTRVIFVSPEFTKYQIIVVAIAFVSHDTTAF